MGVHAAGSEHVTRSRRATRIALPKSGGISFLDTTDAFQARASSGENVSFPDQFHLNERDHAAAAEALAAYLERQRQFWLSEVSFRL